MPPWASKQDHRRAAEAPVGGSSGSAATSDAVQRELNVFLNCEEQLWRRDDQAQEAQPAESVNPRDTSVLRRVG